MRPGKLVQLALIALGSLLLAGCGSQNLPILPPAPLILNIPDCPAPARPMLPLVNGEIPFDAPDNLDVLLTRDDILRRYVKGLEATITCYKQSKGAPDAH